MMTKSPHEFEKYSKFLSKGCFIEENRQLVCHGLSINTASQLIDNIKVNHTSLIAYLCNSFEATFLNVFLKS